MDALSTTLAYGLFWLGNRLPSPIETGLVVLYAIFVDGVRLA